MSNSDSPSLQRVQQALSQGPQSLEQLLDRIDEQAYQALRSAVELGKWPDGGRLERTQLENCLQLVILYEARYLPESERTYGSIPTGCGGGGSAGSAGVQSWGGKP